MDNNKFPPLEPEKDLPEAIPELQDDLPVIQELTFADAASDPEPSPAELPPVPEPDQPDEPDEPAGAEEIPMVSEPEIAEDSPQEPEPAEASPEMDQPAQEIPEVSVPDSVAEEPSGALTEPQSHPEIGPDNQAMDFQGLLAHGQNEPDFPPEFLEELKTNTPAEAVPPSQPEVPADQEYRDNSQDFDTLFRKEEPPKEEAPKSPTEPHFGNKRRPKRKKGEGMLGIPNILVTFVWLALILVIGVTAGRMLWVCAADVLAFGREDKVVTISIYESDSMEDIIDKLHEGGLIRYKSLFSLYADISDAQEDIKPGIYDLNTRYDYHALVNFMSPRSSREVIKLTIPEGYTCRQIFDLLEEKRICTAVDAAAYAANGELSDYWFLNGLDRGSENCLEGYLFPDTYEFYKNSSPREALEKMLDNFETRFDGDMLTQLEALNGRLTGDYTVREIVIVASLIEKESATPGESPMVSGVIYNRLFRWGANPRYLNIDASIVYAQEGENERIDTKLDHPYNTYTNEGLTPGPIANPGLSSLKAALNPETHNYYYYVLNPATGMHQFSTTYEEHTGYVRQFAAASEEQ